MDFGLTETQEMLRNAAREFLEARGSLSLARRSHSDPSAHLALWKEVSGFGWPGVAIDEKYGGSSLGFDDLCVLLEECAAGLMPGPLFEATVLGAPLIAQSRDERLRKLLLPQIASGDAIVTMAHLEGSGGWDDVVYTRAEPHLGHWRISGEKRFVSAGTVSTNFVVSAVTGSGDLLLALIAANARGIEILPSTMASGEPYATVRLTGVNVMEDEIIAAGDKAPAIVEAMLFRAAVARSIQMAGLADALVRRTVEYVTERKQFGKPVGSFQAIQHRLADMATTVRGARHLARSAAWHVSNGRPAQLVTARAKSYSSEHLPRVCWDAHQCHGAIGFTWEHDLHLYTRRMLSWRAEYGDHRHWRRVAAAQLLGA